MSTSPPISNNLRRGRRRDRRHLRLVIDNTRPGSTQRPAATNRAPAEVDQPRAA